MIVGLPALGNQASRARIPSWVKGLGYRLSRPPSYFWAKALVIGAGKEGLLERCGTGLSCANPDEPKVRPSD